MMLLILFVAGSFFLLGLYVGRNVERKVKYGKEPECDEHPGDWRRG